MRIKGNVEGIKSSALNSLEEFLDFQMDHTEFISIDFLNLISEISQQYNREISAYIDKTNKIRLIAIGAFNSVQVDMEGLDAKNFRCVHTHPSGNAQLSSVDLSSLINLRLRAISAVGIQNGIPKAVHTAILDDSEELGYRMHFSNNFNQTEQDILLDMLSHASLRREVDDGLTHLAEERALLVGIESQESLKELRGLSKTAGLIVVDMILQKKDKPDSYSYIGKGKLDELRQSIQLQNINVLVCDDELSPITQKNLEDELNIKIIDRTALILDIFAQHCRTAESKLQVELAQLKYNSSRLVGKGTELSRLGGGIGTRGPGESKLEQDRRKIRARISQLEKDHSMLISSRNTRLEERKNSDLPQLALVGYTNAGKSSLLNALTGSNAYVENKLFATLDSLTRRLVLANGKEALLSDTVGFIRKLPHFLVKSFSSTLEELKLADILIIVLDASDKNHNMHLEVVKNTIQELGISDKKQLIVYNKCDQLQECDMADGICISAKQSLGLEELKQAILDIINEDYVKLDIQIPFSQFNLLPLLHEKAIIFSEEYTDYGLNISASIDVKYANRILKQDGIKKIND